ncbi:5'-3' exoribonuclease 1-like [Anneissia japonica]|uniref:5'-3' exoribonuclease 1-like n=1 Tax=Anneissia japonica TaxID=1529436 RepID=UPI0014256CFE|nr:5'-3' exoribonuclease 1-like [Anneissia japonica]
MGVPKFYRWISERYPCLSEVVKENQIPEFDNLYFDMNGIVHTCSHPDDGNVHFRITEEKIFSDICHYIEVLFRLIKPRKVFYMAIDGCAPRAKMNQQRGRRFRTAKASEEQEKQALAKGEKLPDEKRFDSNCITPGTPFMVRLHSHLQYFISQKVSSDPLWQNIRIYLSGHETPGEGEHKIMDFIRSEKSDQNYDPNTRHCLYGLDADLIMLGLITHEPHFSLLREEVRFGKQAEKKRPTSAEETTFHLLHLSLLREYLDAEFEPLKKFEWYDLENVIDDWVFMGFLVGNDFVPHLPDLHINHDALPLLFKSYMEVGSDLKGFINEGGELNLERLDIYLQYLSKFDRENFENIFVDYSFLESKKGSEDAWKSKRVEEKKKVLRKKENGNAFELIAVERAEAAAEVDFFGKEIPKPQVAEDGAENDQELSSDEVFEKEFLLHKQDYYKNKFEMETVTEERLEQLVKDYVEALQWILYYYYNGVQSWAWYYPHHYAPYMSDLKNIRHLKFTFEKGKPFLPFQQLLGVLPAASRELLPECFQKLMIMDNSPIIDYYPLDFKTDLNGKQQDWEAVVLIPFIDEKRLLSAMDSVANQMTKEERGRNQHGPHLLFTYDVNLHDVYRSALPKEFPDIDPCRARRTEIPMNKFEIPIEKIRKGLCPEVRLGVYFPGFPTLHHLEYTSKIKNVEVKVFQQVSRGDNMILTIKNTQSEKDINELAVDYLGQHVFAEWPHLIEVKVVEIANDKVRFRLVEERGKSARIEKQPMTDQDMTAWVKEIKCIKELYLKRKGVDIGATYILVYAKPMMGRRYTCSSQGKVTLEKEWGELPVAYAHHMLVKDISVHDPTFQQFKTLDELFQVGASCCMLGSPHYGHMAKVVQVVDGRIRIEMNVPVEPDFQSIISRQQNYEQQYFPGYRMAQRLGVTGFVLSRITGSVFVVADGGRRLNVGLNLKFNRTNQEIPGFSRKDTEQGWTYSSQVQQILVQYMRMFPELFRVLSQRPNGDSYAEDEIFGDTPRLNELKDWLDKQECMKVLRVKSGVKQLDEPVINLLEAEVQEIKEKKPTKTCLSVRPHLLFLSMQKMGNLIPDPNGTYELFDRVINVRQGYTVPLGMRGTVVGIQPGERIIDTLYDVVFDEEFSGGFCIRCTGSRGYRMPPTSLISLSHGLRKGGSEAKPTAVVKPVNQPEHTRHRGWYDNAIAKIGVNMSQSSSFRDAQTARKNSSSTVQNQQPRRKDVPQNDSNQHKLTKGKLGQNSSSKSTVPQLGQPVGKFTILPRKSTHQEHVTQNSDTRNVCGNNSTHHKQPDDQKEFANIWKQLQQSEKLPVASASAGVPSSSSTTTLAGNMSPKVTLSPVVAMDTSVITNVTQDESIDDTLDGSCKQTKDAHEVQTNKEMYLQKGTEDLCRLLNINHIASKPVSQPPKKTPVTPQSYGKQINVSQLFAVVDLAQSEPSKPELLSPAYFSSPPQDNSHKPGHPPVNSHLAGPPQTHSHNAGPNSQQKPIIQTGAVPRYATPGIGQFTQIPQGQIIYQPQPTHPGTQTGFNQRRQIYPANPHMQQPRVNQYQWSGGNQTRGTGHMQGHYQGYRQPMYMLNNTANIPAPVRMHHQFPNPSHQNYQRNPGYRGAVPQPRGPPTGPNQPTWIRVPTPNQNASLATPNTFIPLQVTKQMTPTKSPITPQIELNKNPDMKLEEVTAPKPTEINLISNADDANSCVQSKSEQTKPIVDVIKGRQQRKSRHRKSGVKLAINFTGN